MSCVCYSPREVANVFLTFIGMKGYNSIGPQDFEDYRKDFRKFMWVNYRAYNNRYNEKYDDKYILERWEEFNQLTGTDNKKARSLLASFELIPGCKRSLEDLSLWHYNCCEEGIEESEILWVGNFCLTIYKTIAEKVINNKYDIKLWEY